MTISTKEIKSNLSGILPVVEACHILGQETVARIVRSFLHFRYPTKPPTNEDITVLIKALFFDPGENDVPQNILTNWNRVTGLTSGLDKQGFLKFMVPSPAAPYNAPGGHVGLFDCWVHALSASANNYVANGPSPVAPVVLLPDILIAVAVCREYRTVQSLPRSDSPLEDMEQRADYATVMLSILAFRVYDSYQKKGVVPRDTLHRFLSDVHGEDSFKTTSVRKMLDTLYAPPDGSDPAVQAPLLHLSPAQFANGIRETVRNRHHILLDWLAILGDNMVPLAPLAPSVNAYLDLLSASNRSLELLCSTYGLANLYEIKRRFHSLVETNRVVQGDVMKEAQEEEEKKSARKPRHVISQDAFVSAISSASDEMGHGGYLPESLAERVFRTGACYMGEDDSFPNFWALFDVLQFGCDAVRCDQVRGDITSELPLMRFLFKMFGSTPTRRNLSREQVGSMLLDLLEHQNFRMEVDRPPDDEDSNVDKSPAIIRKPVLLESLVDVSAASILSILPPNSARGEHVLLSKLVDCCFQVASVEGNELPFDAFCKWHYSKDPSGLQLAQRRVGPLLLELKLIASVLFGIPPTKASMEEALILEIQRRHRYRYPQTDASRRGPRGTVWYIIEDKWFKRWVSLVQRVAGSDSDIIDGREVHGADVRGLGKINNTSLLADNGTLALKADIRWRHDYEIVPPLAWSALQAWYDGGPPIHRTVVKYIPTNGPQSVHSRSPRVRTEYEIELYPLFVTVFMCDVASRGEARPFQQYAPVSRVSPVGVVLVQLCRGLDVDPKLGRLWMMESSSDELTKTNAAHGENVEDWLLNLELNILEQRNRRSGSSEPALTNRMRMLLELKDPISGKWPRGVDGKSWMFDVKSRQGEGNRGPGESDTGNGIVGLYNMGHTPIFRDYFTSKVYLNDLNNTNPLGHNGKLAQVTAVLINSMWKRFSQPAQPHSQRRITAPGSYALISAPALTPKTFKESLGKFNDHFSGNEQHDAQELLAFLLGGLSEDLNRIVEKPYIEAPDSDGRPDSELADIWWSNHLKREMSIIVALFTGQYKSLLTCRTCKYESARFEPFSFLQLPLPEDDQVSVSLIYYPIAESTPILKYSVRVRHDGKLGDVLIALARVLHADENDEPLTKTGKHNSDDNSEDGDDGSDEIEEIMRERAQNMAVVDMREGFIFKIAPNSWALPDLQNKETGELPLLHIYELDKLPDDSDEGDGADEVGTDAEDLDESDEAGQQGLTNEAIENDKEVNERKFKAVSINLEGEEDDDEDETGNDPRYSFLALAQRRVEVSSRDNIHPFTHQVFGTPLLLRVNDLEEYTGKNLYDLVAQRLKPLVPRSALRFLEGQEATEHAKPGLKEDVASKSSRQRRRRTLSEMETVAAGPIPRLGFRLRISSREGRRCALCPWYQCCIGCLVPDDDFPTIVACGDSISIDWHFAVDVATNGFGSRVNQTDQPGPHSPFPVKTISTVNIRNHASCNDDAKKKGQYGGAITLEDCLDAFAKEEKIPEAYCSRCKDFRVQTKRMSLWRLPPIVIIQLKRFHFTQHTRRKLRDLVVFPLEGLDLSRILAPDSGETSDGAVDSPTKLGTTAALNESIQSNDESETYIDPLDSSVRSNKQESLNGDRRESFSEGLDDPMSCSSYSGRTSGAMLYDLYAVVHHQGALSGGHYVASLKSEVDGQWRLFNDASVYDIHSRDVVDASAYILFYIRRDVKDARLEDFWDIRARAGKGMTEDEVESLMKGRSDRCIIS